MIQPPLNWPIPPEEPRLQPGEIHLWRIPLDDASRLESTRTVLSPDEITRAARFIFEPDRNRFIISHGALRMLLARYLSTEPSALEFRTGPNGKPALIQTFTDLRFNLSHSADLALIAIARGREVGVDVERVQKDILFEQIAEHYFEPAEAWDLRIAPLHERAVRFFDLWTRKEACLKAEGTGLGSRPRPEQFGVRNLCPRSGYSGAVASEGDDWRLACWEWSL